MAQPSFIKQYLDAGQATISNLLLQNFSSIGMTNDDLVTYLLLDASVQKGDVFPDMERLAGNLDISTDVLFQRLHELIQKGIVKIISETNADGRSSDRYDLTPAIEKLARLNQQQVSQQSQTQSQEQAAAEIFSQIEQEFGRPLSPIEYETVNAWILQDHYDPKIIYQALREAVLGGAYSLKYMDKVLLSWEKRNIRTVQQLQADKEKHRQF